MTMYDPVDDSTRLVTKCVRIKLPGPQGVFPVLLTEDEAADLYEQLYVWWQGRA